MRSRCRKVSHRSGQGATIALAGDGGALAEVADPVVQAVTSLTAGKNTEQERQAGSF